MCIHKTSHIKIAKIAWVDVNLFCSSFVYEHHHHHQQQEQRQRFICLNAIFCMVFDDILYPYIYASKKCISQHTQTVNG